MQICGKAHQHWQPQSNAGIIYCCSLSLSHIFSFFALGVFGDFNNNNKTRVSDKKVCKPIKIQEKICRSMLIYENTWLLIIYDGSMA